MNTILLNPHSLSATIDAVNDALLAGVSLTEAEKIAVSKWIAGRQGAPGSYAHMPAPTEEDVIPHVKRWTGESIDSKASLSHCLGEEACRILILLNVKEASVQSALQKSTAGMLAAIERENIRTPDRAGTYCCGGCSPAYWRHLAAGGLANQERELELGMRVLKANRKPDGTWRRFPTAWTLSALVEIGEAAREEMKHAVQHIERYSRVKNTNDVYSMRRRWIAVKALPYI